MPLIKNNIADFYHSFMEDFPGIAYRGTLDFSFIFIHGKILEITGYTPNDFLDGNIRWDEIIYAEDIANIEGYDEVKVVPNFSCKREYRILTKEGKIAWIEERIKNILNDKGMPVEVHGVIFDITKTKELEIANERALQSLKKAITEIKTLRGIIPICSSCKQIRDDKGFWHQVEVYVRDHSEADFSHSLCPDCQKTILLDLERYRKK